MKFTEEHEWLRIEDDQVVVGITEHASQQLGDVVFVELPEAGTTVTKDDEVVVIESVKAASDILAPIDGEITEVNDTLTDEPGRSTTTRWARVVLQDQGGRASLSQLDGYMDEAAYKRRLCPR